MSGGFRFVPDDAAIKALAVRHSGELAWNAANTTARRVRDNISAAGRVDKGPMRQGMLPRQFVKGERTGYLISSPAAYTHFQEFGTRAHGPVRAKMLRFKPKGSGSFVFAKWVRGVPAGNFMKRAFQSLSTRDFTR